MLLLLALIKSFLEYYTYHYRQIKRAHKSSSIETSDFFLNESSLKSLTVTISELAEFQTWKFLQTKLENTYYLIEHAHK